MLWALVGVITAFIVFIGVAEGVALFHPDEKVRKRAHEILRDLLRFLRRAR